VLKKSINKCLMEAVQRGSLNPKLYDLLFREEAAIHYNYGAPLLTAVKVGNASLVKILLGYESVSEDVTSSALQSMIELPRNEKSLKHSRHVIAKLLVTAGACGSMLNGMLKGLTEQRDHQLLRLFTTNGADPSYDEGKSIIYAAMNGDDEALLILCPCSTHANVFTKAFVQLVASNTTKIHGGGVEVMRILLRHGVTQSARDEALFTTVTQAWGKNNARTVMNLLVEHGANVNTRSEQCFLAAAENMEAEAFRFLLDNGLKLHLHLLFNLGLPGTRLEALLNVIVMDQHTESNVKHRDSLKEDLLALAIEKYPYCANMATKLLEQGCRANSVIDYTTRTEVGVEDFSVLLWCIASWSLSVDTGIVTSLLFHGGEHLSQLSALRI